MARRQAQLRFPAARLKKLIQSDEEIGKVANGTPAVVSRSLELFLKLIVENCVQGIDANNEPKRLTPSTLKRTIHTTTQLDFLKDLVADVPDPAPPGEKKKRTRAKPTDNGDREPRTKRKTSQVSYAEDNGPDTNPDSDPDYNPPSEAASDDTPQPSATISAPAEPPVKPEGAPDEPSKAQDTPAPTHTPEPTIKPESPVQKQEPVEEPVERRDLDIDDDDYD